jgi:hypothetical protein
MRRVSNVRLAAVASAILALGGYCGPLFATTPNVTTVTGGDAGQGFDGSVTPTVALSFGVAGTHTVQNATFKDWTLDPNFSIGGNGFFNTGAILPNNTDANGIAMQEIVNQGLYGADAGYTQLNMTDSGDLIPGQQYEIQVVTANNNPGAPPNGTNTSPRSEQLIVDGNFVGEADVPQLGVMDIYADFTATGNDTFSLDAVPTSPYPDSDGLISALTITQVPEPASTGLVVLAAGMIACRRRRKQGK